MKILLNQKAVEKVLETYYKEELDLEGKVVIQANKSYSNFSSDTTCIVEMKIVGKMSFLGEKVDAELQISTDDLKKALSYVMEKEGYTFQYYDMKSGVETDYGYAYGGDLEQKAYFNGIDVTVKEKVFKKGGIQNGKN